jgi:membrane complex biogenesis BtpA family protein
MAELVIVPGGRKVVLGMVHLRPLPGTPYYEPGSLASIVDAAVRSASALAEGGADGCLVQTADRVYSAGEESDPARTAAMALVVSAVARAAGAGFAVGVQMMQNAVKASLAVAKVAGASYIRASAVVGATLTAHGMVQARPLEVMEYRAKIGAQDVKVVGEVGSMHFEWPGGARPVAEVARAAVAVGADAVALGHRDERRTLEMIASVRGAMPRTAVILAGYTNHENAARLLAAADGAFVGTCLESGGWGGPIDPGRVRAYVDIARGLE